jgi:hypothetical protein
LLHVERDNVGGPGRHTAATFHPELTAHASGEPTVFGEPGRVMDSGKIGGTPTYASQYRLH